MCQMATSSGPSSIEPSSTDQTIGGYPFDAFLNLNTTQKDRFTCGYCKQIVRNPVYCPSRCKQGHRYCQSCFTISMVQEQNLATILNCEKCREAVDQLKQLPADATAPQINKIYRPDNALKKSFASIQTKCLNEPCNFTGPFVNYEDHFLECEHQEVECPNNCKTKIKKNKLKEHKIHCEKKDVNCNYCLSEIPRDHWPSHQRTCDQTPERCAHCNQHIKRVLMDKHLVEECAGLLCPFNCENVTEASFQQHKSNKHEQHVKKLLERFKILAYSDVSSLVMYMSRFTRAQIAELIQNVSTVLHPPDPEAPISHPHLNREYACWNYSFLWRIDNVNRTRHEAGRSSIDSPTYYTTHIIYYGYGYRLLVRAHLNGEAGTDAAGLFLSLFICLCRGQSDHLLPWPLRCTLRFTLMDQSQAQRHLEKTLPPLDHDAFKRPESDTNVPIGFNKFASLDTVFPNPLYYRPFEHQIIRNASTIPCEASLRPGPEYLRNDSMLIKCEVEPSM